MAEVLQMRRMLIGTAIGVILALGAGPAAAQSRSRTVQPRTPTEGMWGLGGSIGAAGPSDASLQNGLDLTGNLERYLTSRVSVRGQVGASWWDIQGHNFTGTITPFFADANVVYNWEGGAIHPYVTGGIGVYHFHASETGTQDRSDTEAGINGGGGVEFFFDRRTTLTGELLYHKVGAFSSPLATFQDGSFWRVGFGLKRYF
jgi:opacity protein-like surface antigen